MKKFRFKKIDAFAAAGSQGNPAGVVYLDSLDDITPREMLGIAKELKGYVNEVAYLYQIDGETFGLKYYSAEKEVDFCGHATIASMYDIIKSAERLQKIDRLKIKAAGTELAVFNRIKGEDAVFIQAPGAVFNSKGMPAETTAASLNIDRAQIVPEYPVSIINAGLETLIVPMINLEAVLSLMPGIDELKSFCIDNDIDIITVFSRETAFKSNRFRSRVFAPTFGYLEDPATGSGNAALGYYLLKNNLWEGEMISLEQNGRRDTPNIVKIAEFEDKRIIFGGGALVRVQGEYILH